VSTDVEQVAAGRLVAPAAGVVAIESTFEGASNAGVVAGTEETLVVDARLTPDLGADLRRVAVERTGRKPGLLVLTHPHGDHVFGLGAFAGATVIASSWTRDAMAREWDHQIETFVGLRPAQADAFRAAPCVTPRLTFEGKLELELGDRTVRLLALGHGHTPGDVIVHVPDAGVVFSGDVVVDRNWPLLWDADPDGWLRSLDALAALDPQYVVPGHGRTGGPERIAAMRGCLTFLRELAHGRPDADDVTAAIAASPYADWAYPERVPAALERLRSHG
jgi:cyclase